MVEQREDEYVAHAARPVVWPRPPAEPPAEWPVDTEFALGERTGFSAKLEAVLLGGLFGVAVRLPHVAFEGLIRTLARLGRRFDRRHADAGRRFLLQAFGSELSDDELERRLLEAFRHFFRVAVEGDRFLRRVPLERTFEHVRFELSPRAEEILLGREGAVLVSPHQGSWELSSVFTARLCGRPLYAIAKPVKNRYLSEAMLEARERRGIRILPRRGAMGDAPAVVGAGGLLGMLLDQRANARPVYAPFFGRRARCDRSAGVLVRRLKAPLLLVACNRDPDRPLHFEYRIDEVIEPAELARLSPEGVAARLNTAFERMIRERPEQYFWLHDRYKDTPLEEPAEEPSAAPAT